MGTLLNWEDARKNCAKLGGQLAIIRNQAENDAALRVRVGTEYIWLGGSDKKGEGNWKWINNVKISTYFKPRSGYSNWGVGQPDNYQGINQDCLTFWDSLPGWDDFDCTSKFPSICETSKPV